MTNDVDGFSRIHVDRGADYHRAFIKLVYVVRAYLNGVPDPLSRCGMLDVIPFAQGHAMILFVGGKEYVNVSLFQFYVILNAGYFVPENDAKRVWEHVRPVPTLAVV